MTQSEHINQITFIYQVVNDTCFIQVNNQPIRELTIKGSCEYQGLVNGTWFQIDEKVNHWISFRKDRFQANKWEVFYKSVSNGEIKYYRRIFFKVEKVLIFDFSKKDKWVKDLISGKWKSKY